ncbi:MAG: Rrf2 family transcriptional regulator [Nocardioidaceae bacterium]|nr:Rrf2 family transcriptional regulator [Nocardioidaceae bacterium]MCL2614137.1 Rrf2 family transcriptional regulator [Nocardioidaceae bacterium]
MKLTAYSDYGFRMLVFLAVAPDNRGTVREIAAAYDLSQHHLAKIAQRLVHADLLSSFTGRNGGLKLKVDPATITVGDIVRAVEPDFSVVECLSDDGCCGIAEHCGGRSLFDQALQAFFKVLDGQTLAEAAAEQRGLRADLSMPTLPLTRA